MHVLRLDQFASRLLHAALTPARLAELVANIVGDEIEFGPVEVGPGGIACASGRGVRGEVTARRGTEPGHLSVLIPLTVAVTVQLPLRTIRFTAQAGVRLRLHVTPCAPLAVNVEIADLAADDVSLRLSMSAMTRLLLAAAGDVENLLRRYICEYVRDMVNSPQTRRYTYIDLAELIDRAWDQDMIGHAS